MDTMDVYEALEDRYDDDTFCGDAARMVITGIIDENLGKKLPKDLRPSIWGYVDDVIVQSIKDYIDANMDDIIEDIKTWKKECEKEEEEDD